MGDESIDTASVYEDEEEIVIQPMPAFVANKSNEPDFLLPHIQTSEEVPYYNNKIETEPRLRTTIVSSDS